MHLYMNLLGFMMCMKLHMPPRLQVSSSNYEAALFDMNTRVVATMGCAAHDEEGHERVVKPKKRRLVEKQKHKPKMMIG